MRMTYSESLTTEYKQMVKTQDRFLARQVAVSAGKQSVFKIFVDVIEGLNPDSSDLTKPDDAVLVLPANIRQEASAPVNAVSQGAQLKKIPPEYPIVAKMAREQGTVILAATIGTDGKIRDLEVLVSPSPPLAESALKAVRKWEYTPYLLNGVPVEGETIVNVTYTLGS